ncbi:MAG: DUF1223 domain-containing protein [Geminicoccaceae bacterium]
MTGAQAEKSWLPVGCCKPGERARSFVIAGVAPLALQWQHMKHPVTPLLAVAAVFAAAFFWPADGAAAEPAPVVVELFTAQGCSSCPPADRLLGELAGRADVLPLSFHVTYWDRLGWPDTFGLEDSTRRQQLYAGWLGERRVYTPQMVIGGRIDVVGSARGRVLDAIELLQGHGEPGPELTVTGDRLSVAAGGQGAAAIWLVAFDDHQDVTIERGENRGKTLRYHHVVRELARVGNWHGRPIEVGLPLGELAAAGRDGAAILLQRLSDGVILAAARVPLLSG